MNEGRRQKAEGRGQRDQLMGDLDPPRHVLHGRNPQDRNGSLIEDHQIKDFEGGIKPRSLKGKENLNLLPSRAFA
ncbi:MAG: hypothetical protein ACRC06_06990 [Waterburya sp.]